MTVKIKIFQRMVTLLFMTIFFVGDSYSQSSDKAKLKDNILTKELHNQFFIENIDTCIESIIQSLENKEIFNEIENKNHSIKSYRLRQLDKDDFDSDSLIFEMSEMLMLSSLPEYSVLNLRVLRYYSELRKVHEKYNELLDELLKINFLKRSPTSSRTDTSGYFIGGPLDIISSTGMNFRFDDIGEHWIELSIDYQFDHENQLKPINNYVLRLEMSKRKQICN